MNVNEIWLCLLMGLVPYRVERQCLEGMYKLEIKALYWLLACISTDKTHQWIIQLPLIERLRNVAWAVLMSFLPKGATQEQFDARKDVK